MKVTIEWNGSLEKEVFSTGFSFLRGRQPIDNIVAGAAPSENPHPVHREGKKKPCLISSSFLGVVVVVVVVVSRVVTTGHAT